MLIIFSINKFFLVGHSGMVESTESGAGDEEESMDDEEDDEEDEGDLLVNEG